MTCPGPISVRQDRACGAFVTGVRRCRRVRPPISSTVPVTEAVLLSATARARCVPVYPRKIGWRLRGQLGVTDNYCWCPCKEHGLVKQLHFVSNLVRFEANDRRQRL